MGDAGNDDVQAKPFGISWENSSGPEGEASYESVGQPPGSRSTHCSFEEEQVQQEEIESPRECCRGRQNCAGCNFVGAVLAAFCHAHVSRGKDGGWTRLGEREEAKFYSQGLVKVKKHGE